jgi:hypothetical protein
VWARAALAVILLGGLIAGPVLFRDHGPRLCVAFKKLLARSAHSASDLANPIEAHARLSVG